MGKIYDSILDTIGNTPIVRLKRVGHGLPVELLGKCEFLNAGGSVKDRIGVRMVADAEAQGRIHPGQTLIEPTSGNTGIGLAIAAAVKGYRMIITMPEKMSREKQVVLEALGAEIIRTPTEAAWDAPESHIGVARRLRDVIPGADILDQYSNPSNPDAHHDQTAGEILEQLDGKLDVLVATAGTGGTITGVAKRLKAEIRDLRVVGVDPYGSILGGGDTVHSYKVEGIGYDFIPDVLDREVVDEWVKVNDRDSFLMARRLIRLEGLLVGGSSGSCVWAAVQVAQRCRKKARVLTILPDSVRNYLTKFVDDRWMRENGFVETDWSVDTIGEVLRAMPPRKLITAQVDDSIAKTVSGMKEHGISQVPVLDGERLVGIVTESDLLQVLVSGRARLETSLAEVMVRRVSTVSVHEAASSLPERFNQGEVGLVLDEQQRLVGIITKMDLIEFLSRRRGGKEVVG